ncbi:MAG: PaaI family thioesterase [Solirubrobacterales bacterium]|nr:PaaI family thioesterase [Solirubrobacterales bacterium]
MSSASNGWGSPRTKTVRWYDPAIAKASAVTMPGREFLQAIIDGRVPPPPFAQLTGAELVSVGDGVAVFRCAPDESTYNPLGLVHGGVLCTLLDSAAGCAVHSQLPAGVGFSSIEIKVSFLRPANGATLEIEGRSLQVGRQIAFAEAHARTVDGKLVGHATTSLALLRPSQPE